MLSRRTGGSDENAEQQHAQCPIKYDDQTSFHEANQGFSHKKLYSLEEGFLESQVSGSNQAKQPRSRRPKPRVSQQHHLSRTHLCISGHRGRTSLWLKQLDASSFSPKRSAARSEKPAEEKGSGFRVLKKTIRNLGEKGTFRGGSRRPCKGCEVATTSRSELVRHESQAHAVGDKQRGTNFDCSENVAPPSSQSTLQTEKVTRLGVPGANGSAAVHAEEQRPSTEQITVHLPVPEFDTFTLSTDPPGRKRSSRKKCQPIVEAPRTRRGLRNARPPSAVQARRHGNELRLAHKGLLERRAVGNKPQKSSGSSQVSSSAEPSARDGHPFSTFSSSDPLDSPTGLSYACHSNLKADACGNVSELGSGRQRRLLRDVKSTRRSSFQNQPPPPRDSIFDRVPQFSRSGANSREAALRELERRRRVPAVTSASPLPFPYLNRANISCFTSTQFPQESHDAENVNSQPLEQAEKPRQWARDGLIGWLWRRMRDVWSAEDRRDASSLHPVSTSGAPSAQAGSRGVAARSLSAQTGRSCASLRECGSGSEGSGAPRPSQPSLPRHLQLQLQLLLSREDRLYYGETFASYVRHGCGFALYGGWVGTGGDGGAWATRAIQRLGLVSRRSPWALLPVADPAPLRGAGRGRAPGGHAAVGGRGGSVGGTRSLGGYCGFWRLDKREGWGVMLRGPSALKYEGQWLGDAPHGLGMLTLSQGGRYVGTFRNGVKHGTGILVHPGGLIYAGEWKGGRVVRQQLLFAKKECELRRSKWKPNSSCSSSSSSSSTSVSESRERRGVLDAGSFGLQRMQRGQKIPALPVSGRTPINGTVAKRVSCSSSSEVSSITHNDSDGGVSDLAMGTTCHKQRPSSVETEPRQLSTAAAVPTWQELHVQTLLENVGFATEIRNLFSHQQVDGPALLVLREADLVQMGVVEWEQRRLLLLLQDLLLKLLHRNRMRSMCNSQWLQDEQLIQQIVIPASEIQIEAPIGEGGYSKVFRAKWRYTQSMETQLERASCGSTTRGHCSKFLDGLDTKEDGAPERERDHWSRKHGVPLEVPSKSNSINSGRIRDHLDDPSLKAGYNLEMRVAVKVFRQRDVQQLQRSLRSELHVLQLLRHPNVVLLLGVVGAPLFGLVTEYVTGGSLFDLLHKRRMHLPLMEVVRLAREVALGMEYLHARGVMHCDLKSPNILISKNGDVKLCDFGLATLVEAGGGSRSPWWLQQPQLQNAREAAAHLGCVGTHHWMAPEGLSSAAHLITAVGYGGLTPPLENIPPPLTGLLHLCLQTQPEKRPTFAACAEALHNMYTTSLMDVEGDLNALLGLGE